MSEAEEFLKLSDQAFTDIEKMKNSQVSVRPLYNRLYYGVFYAAKAALFSIEKEPKTHRGVASQIFTIFYRDERMISKDTAIVLQRLQQKRDMADYEIEVNFDQNDFENDLEKGKRFVEKMKTIID